MGILIRGFSFFLCVLSIDVVHVFLRAVQVLVISSGFCLDESSGFDPIAESV